MTSPFRLGLLSVIVCAVAPVNASVFAAASRDPIRRLSALAAAHPRVARSGASVHAVWEQPVESTVGSAGAEGVAVATQGPPEVFTGTRDTAGNRFVEARAVRR